MDFITRALMIYPGASSSSLPEDAWTPPSGYHVTPYHGVSGLLVLIATVCVVGVTSAAIRTVWSLRPVREEPVAATLGPRSDPIRREAGRIYGPHTSMPVRSHVPPDFDRPYGRHARINTSSRHDS